MSWIRMAIGGVAFVGIASVASAQAPQGGGSPQQGRTQGRGAQIAARLFAGIDLTEAQTAQIQKITDKYNEEKPVTPAEGGEKPAVPHEGGGSRMLELITRSQAEYRAILNQDQQKIFDKNFADIKDRIEQRMKQMREG